MKVNKTLVFSAIFCTSIVVQGVGWSTHEPLDAPRWADVITETAASVFMHPQLDNLSYPYGYPATTLLFSGAVLTHFGISSTLALRLTLLLFISLGAALTGTIAYTLRPTSLWWIGAAGFLILQNKYYGATPPSSMVLPFISAIALLTLYSIEKRAVEPKFLLSFGAIGGFSLATRLDISLAFVGASCLILAFFIQRRIWLLLLAILVSFVFFDPYVWAYPLEHFGAIIYRIRYSYTSIPYAASLLGISRTASLAAFSVFFGMVILLVRRRLLPIPVSFYFWLLGVCAIVMGILFASPNFHPIWYFYPLFLIWEILLPLFVLAPIEETDQLIFGLRNNVCERLLIGSLLLMQIFLFTKYLYF